MNATQLETVVRRALEIVNGSDPDRARDQNGVGFNKLDGDIGRSLLSKSEWTPKQLETACRIARRYRGQHGVELPPLHEVVEIVDGWARARAEAEASEVAKASGLPEWGLTWSAPRTVSTKHGLRIVRTSKPNAAFWTEWKARKESIKAKGYSIQQAGGGWEVAHWSVPAQAPKDEDIAAKPVRNVAINAAGLMSYQVPAVEGIVASLQRWNAALDASDTGTGKTYVAVAAMRALGLRPLVVAPKSVLPSWKRASSQLGHPLDVVNYELVRAGNTEWGRWETVEKNGRSFDRFVWSKQVRALVFDEAHRCKGPKTQNSGLMVSARMQDIPTIAASATAVQNPMEMRALGFLLGLHGLRDFYDWASSHGCHRNRWDGWEFGGAIDDMTRIHDAIFPERGVRVRISDLGDLFPKTLITTRLVDVMSPDAISREYAKLDKVFSDIAARRKTDKGGAEHLTSMLRARQVSEAQKLPAAIELATDALEQGQSVFIACCFDPSINVLVDSLSKVAGPVEVIRGGQDDKEREEGIQRFQANKSRVIVANIRAGGVGVSLHDLHDVPRTAIILPSWSSTDLKQSLGRVWRANGRSKSIQHVLYAKGTVEERVAQLLEEKLRRLAVFNDGLAEFDVSDGDLACSATS